MYHNHSLPVRFLYFSFKVVFCFFFNIMVQFFLLKSAIMNILCLKPCKFRCMSPTFLYLGGGITCIVCFETYHAEGCHLRMKLISDGESGVAAGAGGAKGSWNRSWQTSSVPFKPHQLHMPLRPRGLCTDIPT